MRRERLRLDGKYGSLLTESSLLKKRFQAGYEDMKEKHGLVVGELASEVDPPVCDKKKDDLQKKESDGEFEFKFSYAPPPTPPRDPQSGP